jgi:hypothetical protein
VGQVARTRLLLIASASAGAALMLWGYIAPRYLGDFVPFLMLGSAVAMADIFRRLSMRSRRVRIGAVSGVAVLALFSVWANVGMAIVPNDEWNTTQALNYVEAQSTLSGLTGNPLQAQVHRGTALPPWAPAGQLYVIGDCSGLYVSNGENYSTVPYQQYTRTTWMTVELGRSFQHAFSLHVTGLAPGRTASMPLLTAGPYTIAVDAAGMAGHATQLEFSLSGPRVFSGGPVFDVSPRTTLNFLVTNDPGRHLFSASLDGVTQVFVAVPVGERVRSPASKPGKADGMVVSPIPAPRPTLCRSLVS